MFCSHRTANDVGVEVSVLADFRQNNESGSSAINSPSRNNPSRRRRPVSSPPLFRLRALMAKRISLSFEVYLRVIISTGHQLPALTLNTISPSGV